MLFPDPIQLFIIFDSQLLSEPSSDSMATVQPYLGALLQIPIFNCT